MVSGIRFDEFETDMGTCFPIHFVVSLYIYVSPLMQIDSKSKNGQVFKQLLILSVWNIERIQLFKEGFS